ncbi:hypothetical protein L3i22_075930 [Actinoplanes sp. L3-i22]|nr:hypothetical protein L3i22_075930 [Actinoplanes sp. L3-i22]
MPGCPRSTRASERARPAGLGRLGALLFQFPPWSGITRSNKEYPLEVTARCGPPILEPTVELAVVRFHGDRDKWTSKNIQEKFGYRYSDEELADRAPKLRALAAATKRTHVLMNNCLGDYAQRNATTLLDLLGDAAQSPQA